MAPNDHEVQRTLDTPIHSFSTVLHSQDFPNMSAAKNLRALLAEKSKIIVCPGVYDGFTARIALNEGFDCLYMVSEAI
jgi:hypothetical protein